MNILRLLPAILSLLLLAAHFFRNEMEVLTGVCVVLPLLLFFRERWVPSVIQVALILGVVEWLYTLYSFAQVRIAMDQPWTRLALILGTVALFTGLSTLVFRNRYIRQRYKPRRDFIA
ncbi:MAG: 4Fe-4S ferredoxin, partial [Gammaproteobacteria bacterium]|jgi:hypothetical protein|nr:4Fe-4S ferredoxin [Gammaproteobacteria bacterium]